MRTAEARGGLLACDGDAGTRCPGAHVLLPERGPRSSDLAALHTHRVRPWAGAQLHTLENLPCGSALPWPPQPEAAEWMLPKATSLSFFTPGPGSTEDSGKAGPAGRSASPSCCGTPWSRSCGCAGPAASADSPTQGAQDCSRCALVPCPSGPRIFRANRGPADFNGPLSHL